MAIKSEKSRYSEDWFVLQEFSCINDLTAWFVIATVEEASEAELGYTDDKFGSAELRADRIVWALSQAQRPARDMLDPPEPAPSDQRAKIDSVLRTYFRARYAPVQMSSDGIERVYCNGFPFKDLVDTVMAAVPGAPQKEQPASCE